MTALTKEIADTLWDYYPTSGVLVWRSTCPRTGWANKEAGCLDPKSGYVRVGYGGRSYLMHRVVWLITHGEWPKHNIDHLNGIRCDNRIANLRDVSQSVNARNSRLRCSNKSGVPGVHFYKPLQKWCAQIKVDGQLRHLGYFDDIGHAAAARRDAQSGMGFGPNHAQ